MCAPLLLQQVAGVFQQQALDLWEVMLLGQGHGLVPLVEQHAAVDGGLAVASLRREASSDARGKSG